ncbi:MAG: ferritin family protein [Candidatus Hatepunaea meridiana]|nr:ferritin family protein [Candidatus Hatepunaea meridiana]
MLASDLTIIEVLGQAVMQEVEAYKRYQLFASRVKNPLVQEKFNSLANEEKAHRELLYGMLCKYTGEEKPPLPKEAPRESGKSDEELSLPEILQLAIRKEQEAQVFYADAAKLATDPSGKRVLEYLAEFERGHERLLQTEYDSITKYPQWFDIDGADIMLVGP